MEQAAQLQVATDWRGPARNILQFRNGLIQKRF